MSEGTATSLDRYRVTAVDPNGRTATFVLAREGIVNLLTELPDYRLLTVEPLVVADSDQPRPYPYHGFM
jgi:hypothetical protein